MPQFQLYLLVLKLFNLRYDLIPDNCDIRCVDSTIINRAYYSSYLYTIFWLFEVHQHKLKSKKDFSKKSEFITEHAQARIALKKYGEEYLGNYLKKLAELRNKADYYPYDDLTSSDVDKAIGYMESIFQGLNFD